MRRYERIFLYLMMLSKRLSERQLMIIMAVIVGLMAGFATFVFEVILHYIKSGLVSWFKVDNASFLFLIYPVVGIILASLFVKYIVRDDISEGVTKVLYSMSRGSSHIKGHNCYTSIIGGGITIGFGGSVGPEAPIVLTGAAIGSNMSRLLRLNYKNTTLLLCCGAAAAIAAIFKAPITGVVFVLEILMLDITMGAIVPLLISTVTATMLVFFLKGFDPLFTVNVTGMFHLKQIPMYILLGIICGFGSYYFTNMNARVIAFFARQKTQARKWLWGGLILGILIFLFPPLYGEGYDSFGDILHGNVAALFDNSLFYKYSHVAWVVVVYLLVVVFFKVIAMAATNAAGGVGGTFAPSLFVGAFIGTALAFACNAWFGMNLPIPAFALIGMAGIMSGVMNAPMTSIFLIAELSNGYDLFVPLMLVSSISFFIDYYLEPDSIYTKKLRQKGELLSHNKDRSVLVFLNLNSLIETDFTPIKLDTRLGDLVEHIAAAHRNIFPVLDADEKLLGVVQLDDLRADMFQSDKYDHTIEQYMIPPPDTITVNESIDSVLEKFELSRAWMLPVLDKTGVYKGFISKSRILAAYRQQLISMSQE